MASRIDDVTCAALVSAGMLRVESEGGAAPDQ